MYKYKLYKRCKFRTSTRVILDPELSFNNPIIYVKKMDFIREYKNVMAMVKHFNIKLCIRTFIAVNHFDSFIQNSLITSITE